MAGERFRKGRDLITTCEVDIETEDDMASPPLLPITGTFLSQIEQRYKAEGLIIAGYYQANENIKDNV